MENYVKLIKKAWQDFIQEGYTDYTVRSEIYDSWKRCKSYGVDPMNGRGNDIYKVPIKLKIEENAELILVTRPIMESVYNIVAGSGFAIMLVDKEGYIIHIIGDKHIMKRADELNFVKGALWTEKAVGTNAIGTALYLDKPVQTIGAEHFGVNQHSWTCSGAPIHDSEGNIIGCINMSGNCYDAHSHTLGIVMAAAKSIEKQLELTLANKLMNITFDSMLEGIIILDDKLGIKSVNNRSVQILQITYEEALNINIADTLKHINFNNIINKHCSSFNNEECDFYIKTKRIKCIINAVPMKINNKIVGIVLTFRESKYLHKLVNKVIGYKASYNFEDIITKNPLMNEMIKFSKKAAKSDCNIIIEGESGTGKELIAQSIHNYSNRSEGAFVAVNCGSIPRELVESELFGYEGGAFTGASKEGHPGKFELADGGTIFLDEIGELPLDIQSKLLRVLDNNKITRVGGIYEKQLNVRVIGATNRILKEEIKKKNFREDLYYRLNVMNIKTIPLRERKEDIEMLINHFVKALNVKSGLDYKMVGKAYIGKLENNYWQGNVRELRNTVERDYYLSDDNLLSGDYLTNDLSNFNCENNKSINIIPIQVLEKESIENAILNCEGNIVKAAQFLNMSRSSIYRKIKKYKINNVKKKAY